MKACLDCAAPIATAFVFCTFAADVCPIAI